MINNTSRFVCALKSSYKILTHNMRRNIVPKTDFARSYSSALYISGKKAHQVFAFLSPYLDFDNRFANIDKLQQELMLRQINIDVVELKKTWEFYKKMDADKCALEDKNTELTGRVRTLLENTERTKEDEQEVIKLRMQLKIVRKDLKVIKEAIWELDESVIERVLKLPNELDPKTPTGDPMVLKTIGNIHELPEKNRKSHIDIGTNLGLLDYKNPIHYYLCDDAALFELAVLAYVDRILNDDNMIRVAGTDFSRSLIVEGSGLNHEDPATAFVIENHTEVERESPNHMHLVGGASLMSFLALHTKQLINPNNFPLRYFATGRQYTPLPSDVKPLGLFTACQASVAHAFVVVKEANGEQYKVFEELLESVCRIYNDLCDHYRVIMRSASELQPWEGLRISFEMWSPFANKYIEIGYISMCGDYFSKRLLITYQTPTGRDFPVVISGTILSVPRLLACLLEQNPAKFVIPPKVVEYMPTDYVTM